MTIQTDFASKLLDWYDRHGRHDLPWQQDNDAYRIWVSEIMLQQTQVTTVIAYFERFITRFPDIVRLANAPLDEVLYLWSGLGYYARARNLHHAAQRVRDEYGGVFPQNFDDVVSLPGIGRSTAGAILAFSTGQRHVILDGNVKRVLTRFYAIEGYSGDRQIEQRLWRLAGRNTPEKRVSAYTQAIMDLGALICTRTRPKCTACPVTKNCRARRSGQPTAYPASKLKKNRPLKQIIMLMARNHSGDVLLIKRPPSGIWGGLWGFPEFQSLKNLKTDSMRELGLGITPGKPWPIVKHGFTHYELHITPVPAKIAGESFRAMDSGQQVWYNIAKPDARGLAAPVTKLLNQLKTIDE